MNDEYQRCNFSQNEQIDKNDYKMLLDLWANRAHKAAQAHYIAAQKALIFDRWITASNAILSVSVLFFVTAEWIQRWFMSDGDEHSRDQYLMVAGILSLMVVITTIMHYLFDLQRSYRKHQRSGQQYSSLMKKMERYVCSKHYYMNSLHVISRQYSNITNHSPTVSKKVWNDPSLEKYTSTIRDLEKQAQEDLFGFEQN